MIDHVVMLVGWLVGRLVGWLDLKLLLNIKRKHYPRNAMVLLPAT